VTKRSHRAATGKAFKIQNPKSKIQNGITGMRSHNLKSPESGTLSLKEISTPQPLRNYYESRATAEFRDYI
jgi:hypothetical protein